MAAGLTVSAEVTVPNYFYITYMCSSNCKIILTLLSLIFTVFVAGFDIREEMPVDTISMPRAR